jgi:hypothetical protein
MLLALALAALVAPPAVLAQARQNWLVRQDVSGRWQAVAARTDGVYTVGSLGTGELLVARYDVRGANLWTKSFPGKVLSRVPAWVPRTSRGAAVDGQGNLVVTGGGGFVLKLDPAGDVVWETDVTAALPNVLSFEALAIDAAGNVHVAGAALNATEDLALAKLDATGAVVWAQAWDGAAEHETADDLGLDGAGNVYVGGTTGARLALWSFAPGGALRFVRQSTAMVASAMNHWAAVSLDVDALGASCLAGNRTQVAGMAVDRYDAAGNLAWENLGTTPAMSADVVLDAAGACYVVGAANPNSTFNGYGVQKFAAAGELLWGWSQSTWGDSVAYAATLDPAGGVIVTGEWGYSPSYLRTVDLTGDGQVRWNDYYSPNTAIVQSANYGLAIVRDTWGNVYAAGYTYSWNPTLVKYVDGDLDRDGYPAPGDCNDGDATVFPGAPETKLDGVDQDCNGHDLTIQIVKAYYETTGALKVDATSSLGAGAKLELVGFGPMMWKAPQQQWQKGAIVAPAPATVTVCGVEGCTSAPVVLR